jgi:hypothetical protein
MADSNKSHRTRVDGDSSFYPCKGINLYLVLSDTQTEDLTLMPKDTEFWCGIRSIGVWRLCHITLSESVTKSGVKQDEYFLDDLPKLLNQMFRLAAEIRFIYAIIHVDSINYPNEFRDKISLHLRDTLDEFLEPNSYAPLGYYLQYDDIRKKTGFILVSNKISMIADCSDTVFQILTIQLQSGQLSQDESGINEQTFQLVLLRLAIWNGSQDVRESIDNIEKLSIGADASTKGQIGTAYALSAIGIVLSLFSFGGKPELLLPSLIVFGLSSISYVRHTRTAEVRFWMLLGQYLFWTGTLLGGVGLVLSLLVKK